MHAAASPLGMQTRSAWRRSHTQLPKELSSAPDQSPPLCVQTSGHADVGCMVKRRAALARGITLNEHETRLCVQMSGKAMYTSDI